MITDEIFAQLGIDSNTEIQGAAQCHLVKKMILTVLKRVRYKNIPCFFCKKRLTNR